MTPDTESYENEHKELHFKITKAIINFEEKTKATVTRVSYRPGVCEVRTNLSSPLPLGQMIPNELQRRLDFLDELIDTLDRKMKATPGNDLSIIQKAKDIQQRGREYFSRGDLDNARYAVSYAEIVVGVGEAKLPTIQQLSEEFDRILSGGPQ